MGNVLFLLFFCPSLAFQKCKFKLLVITNVLRTGDLGIFVDIHQNLLDCTGFTIVAITGDYRNRFGLSPFNVLLWRWIIFPVGVRHHHSYSSKSWPSVLIGRQAFQAAYWVHWDSNVSLHLKTYSISYTHTKSSQCWDEIQYRLALHGASLNLKNKKKEQSKQKAQCVELYISRVLALVDWQLNNRF